MLNIVYSDVNKISQQILKEKFKAIQLNEELTILTRFLIIIKRKKNLAIISNNFATNSIDI